MSKKCEPCIIINELTQIGKQCLAKNFNTPNFCFKCAANVILKMNKTNCSSCLKEITRNTQDLNKYCVKDLVCKKCFGIPIKNMLSCFYCDLLSFLAELNENADLILNHEKMKCCYDFCDLSLLDAKDIIKLNCGHRSCPFVKEKAGLCTICSIKRLLKMFEEKNDITVVELTRLPFEQKFENLVKQYPYDILITDDEDEPVETSSKNEEKIKDGINEKIILDSKILGFDCNTIEHKFFVPNGSLKVLLNNLISPLNKLNLSNPYFLPKDK